MGAGVRAGTATPLNPDTSRSSTNSNGALSGSANTDTRASGTTAATYAAAGVNISDNTTTDVVAAGGTGSSRGVTGAATTDVAAGSSGTSRGLSGSANTDSMGSSQRSSGNNYTFPANTNPADTMNWNQDATSTPILDDPFWVPTIGIIREPVTRPRPSDIDSRIAGDISRHITRPELPRLLTIPTGFTCYEVLSENFNLDLPGSSPVTWTGGSGIEVVVTDELAYTYPNSLKLGFPNTAQLVPVTRSLAPWIPLSNTRPLILQFLLNFGVAQTRGRVSICNKAEVTGVPESNLIKIFRTGREQKNVQIRRNEVTLVDAVSTAQYYYADRPDEVYFNSEGVLTSSRPLDDIRNVSRSMGSIGNPAASIVSNELVENRTTQTETYIVDYADISGNVLSASLEVLPYSTERGSRLKLLGWNTVTVLCLRDTFDLYINETRVVSGGYYLDYLDAGIDDKYLGLLKVGGVETTTKDTVGTIFVDDLNIYALHNPEDLPSGWAYQGGIPLILGNTQLPAYWEEHQSAISGSANQEFDTSGCLIVRMSDVQLYPDVNGCFTWSNEIECTTKYTSVSDLQIDSAGRVLIGPSSDYIKRCVPTNVYIDIDGTMVVGGTLDNKLDTIPFDYERGEFILVGALITNDDTVTPVLTKISFEFD